MKKRNVLLMTRLRDCGEGLKKERFIRNQEEYYKTMQQERDTESEKVKGTLNDKIERLQECIEEREIFIRNR